MLCGLTPGNIDSPRYVPLSLPDDKNGHIRQGQRKCAVIDGLADQELEVCGMITEVHQEVADLPSRRPRSFGR